MGSSPVNGTIFIEFMAFDATFWLLVSFVVFVVFSFKKLRVLAGQAILKYYNGVKSTLEEYEKKQKSSHAELEELKEKAGEIEEICHKMVNNARIEASRIEKEAVAGASSYLSFKKRNTEERIEILQNEALAKLKAKVTSEALKIAVKYIEAQGVEPKISRKELESALKSAKL